MISCKCSSTLEEKYIEFGTKHTTPNPIDEALIPGLWKNLFTYKTPTIIYKENGTSDVFTMLPKQMDNICIESGLNKTCININNILIITYPLIDDATLQKIYIRTSSRTDNTYIRVNIAVQSSTSELLIGTYQLHNYENIINIKPLDTTKYDNISFTFENIDAVNPRVYTVAGYGTILTNEFSNYFSDNNIAYKVVNYYNDVSFPRYIQGAGFKIGNGQQSSGFLKADGTVDTNNYLINPQGLGSETVPVYVTNNAVTVCKPLTYIKTPNYNGNLYVYTDIPVKGFSKIYLHMKEPTLHIDTTVTITYNNTNYIVGLDCKELYYTRNELLNVAQVNNMIVFNLLSLSQSVEYDLYCECITTDDSSYQINHYNHITNITKTMPTNITSLSVTDNNMFYTLNSGNIDIGTKSNLVLYPAGTVITRVYPYLDTSTNKIIWQFTTNNLQSSKNPSLNL